MPSSTGLRAAAFVFTLAVTGTAAAAGTVSADRPQLAVMDLEAKSLDPTIADTATESVVGAIRDLRTFKVITRSEVRQLLSIDKDRRTAAGSSCDESCMVKIGETLGSRYLVTGSVSGIDRKPPYTLVIKLMDSKKNDILKQETRTDLKTQPELYAAASSIGVLVLRPLLNKEQGLLMVEAHDNGATVTIDGTTEGVTPFPMKKLGWGPHRVVIEKNGFIAWAKDVHIEKDQVTTESVTLIPSPDFVEAYKSHNRLLRVGAYATTALAVVGLGVAGYVQFAKVDPTYNKFEKLGGAWNTPSSDANRSQSIDRACTDAAASDPALKFGGTSDQPACYDYTKGLATKGTSYVTTARVAAIGGVVMAAAATYFWLASDDPGKYDDFVKSEAATPAAAPAATEKPAEAPKASLMPSLVPLHGGGMALLSFTF